MTICSDLLLHTLLHCTGSPWQGISFIYGPGTGLILLSGLSCSGYETTLLTAVMATEVLAM